MKLKNPNIAPLISVKDRTEYHTSGFCNTHNWVPYESLSRTGIEGTQNKVASNTSALIVAKKPIATANEVWLAMKLVTGTPNTIPADTPMNTLDTAFDASSLRVD